MMKSTFFIIIGLLFYCSDINAQQGIQFETGNWKDVLTKAKKEQKPIFIDIYTSWCGPCKQMANEIFPQQIVGNYFNANFINYKIDAEKGEGVSLAKKYNVSSYPTYLFIDADNENLIHKVIGAYEAAPFIETGKKAFELHQVGDLTALEKQYETKKNDTSFMLTYISKRAYAGQNINDALYQYICLLPENERVSAKTAVMLSDYTNQISPEDDALLRFYFENKDKFAAIDLYTGFIYRKIIDNSTSKAIANKDEKLLQKLIALDQKMNGGTADLIAQTYYYGVNDVDKYLSFSKKLFNNWMQEGSDGILMKNQKEYENYVKNFEDNQKKQIISNQQKQQMQQMGLWPIANSLNSAAEYILTHTKNTNALREAMKWSKLAVNLNLKRIKYFETYAKLLYSLKYSKTAIEELRKACNFVKEDVNKDVNIKDVELLITQIKSKALIIK